jgi:hypothetical protein
MPKTVLIAHPMTGDIEGNTKKVEAICREIHSAEIIPIFPSFTTRRYLTPDPKDRELAKAHIKEYFKRGMVDEVWLYGDNLTQGMLREIKTANEHSVPVTAKTPQTKEFLAILRLEGFHSIRTL